MKHLVIIGILFATAPPAVAESQEEVLYNMSSDELFNVSVHPGSLTRVDKNRLPVSVTTITAEQIALTPARNIYDLIEVYVPGALWVNHYEGPHPGIRGIISERNYKFLLLVNGHLVNQKAHNGATIELGHWDLSDIETIEVIRGPGSVTYGPGAIMGIIKITTRNSTSFQGKKGAISYFAPYNSVGVAGTYGERFDRVGTFVHASLVKTEGVHARCYGRGAYLDNREEFPTRYFSDYRENEPQVKFHLGFELPHNITWETRYTSWSNQTNGWDPKRVRVSGVSLDSISPPLIDTLSGDTIAPGDAHYSQSYLPRVDAQYLIAKGFSSVLSHKVTLGKINIATRLSFDTENARLTTPPAKVNEEDDSETIIAKADPYGFYYNSLNFSEDEYMGHLQVNFLPRDNLEIALGVEATYNVWGPAWGEDKKLMRLGDRGRFISDEYSRYWEYGLFDSTMVRNTEYFFIGDGWNSHAFSAFTELNWELTPFLTLLVSGRYDKDQYSPHLFSPRLALLSSIRDKHFVRLIGQQSQRMNTAEQLHVRHIKHPDDPGKPETLSGIECIYSFVPASPFSFSTALFYNNLEVIGWSPFSETGGEHETRRAGGTGLLGKQEIGGIEAELSINHRLFTLNINHAYTKQLDFSLSLDSGATGISYRELHSHFTFPDGGTITYTGSGNDLSNWSNHATKFNGQFYLGNRVKLHCDGRVFWGYEGEREIFSLIDNAATTQPVDPDYFEEQEYFVSGLKREDAFGIDARLNIGCEFTASDHFSATLYIQNLVTWGNGKRYSYDWAQYFQNVNSHNIILWVDEPRTFGGRITFSW